MLRNFEKTFTIRLPESLIERLALEAKARRLTTSDVVRERLSREQEPSATAPPLAGIADLIGSIEGTSPDLSARKKHYLKTSGYGEKRHR